MNSDNNNEMPSAEAKERPADEAKERPAAEAKEKSTAEAKEKEPKRRLSASEYQKYVVMEQGMEVDSQGNAHLAEEEVPDMLIRIPSWMAISSDSTTKDDEVPHYVTMEKKKQEQQQEQPYMQTPTRWQRWKAEVCDLFHELVHYTKTKSWKKKVLTVVVCASSLFVFADLLFFGNIRRWLDAFIFWMGDHIVEGIVAFIGLFVVTTRTYLGLL